jgi:hypothetical protein
MPDPGRIYRSGTNVMSIAMVLVGFALIVRTIAAGGAIFATGIVLGALFILGGGVRYYAATRRRDGDDG